MKKTEEIAVQEQETALAVTGYSMGELMEEMEGLGSLSFERIKVPAAGGIAFALPSDDGRPKAATEITGIIVHHQPRNVYYREAFNGESNRPDCASNDGKTGTQTNSGAVRNCAACPYNQFGSKDGGGKACQNRMDLYIMTEGATFPVVVDLPATSLKAFKEYLGRRVVLRGMRLNEVYTEISLTQAKSGGNIAYSTCVFRKVGNVEPEKLEESREMRELCRGIAMTMDVVPEEEEGGSGEFVELSDEDEELGMPF